MKNRFLTVVVTLALTLSLAPSAYAGIAWRLVDGVLVFSGTGSTSSTVERWKRGILANATGLELQSGVTEVHDAAFSGMAKLSTVTAADTVTGIGRYAFDNCTGLAEVQMPAALTFLGEHAFKNCTALERIALPRTLKRVEQGTFSGCSALREIELGSDVFYIGKQAFKGCTAMSVFAVPEKVKRIYPETFSYCTGLVQIYLPAGLERVDADSFSECVSLTDVYYGGTREQWDAIVREDARLDSAAVAVRCNARPDDLDKGAQGTGTAGLRFDDVLPDYWGYKSILAIAEHGLVTGTRQPDANGMGSFSPEGKVTLGQFLVVVTRLVCPEARRDISGHWARGSYQAALETGIIAEGDFYSTDQALDGPLSRQDMAYILVRAARLQGESFSVHPDARAGIRDFGWVAENRRQAVLECYSNGIISGFGDGTFGPDATMTRAQMAVVVCRLAGWQSRAEVSFQ